MDGERDEDDTDDTRAALAALRRLQGRTIRSVGLIGEAAGVTSLTIICTDGSRVSIKAEFWAERDTPWLDITAAFRG